MLYSVAPQGDVEVQRFSEGDYADRLSIKQSESHDRGVSEESVMRYVKLVAGV